jgi:hypothetical protein
MVFFELNRRQVVIQTFLRRLLDVTCPAVPPLEGERRRRERIQRVIPVLLLPWERNRPMVEEVSSALTKDFGDCSVAVVLNQPFRSEEAVVGIWLEGPNYLQGVVEQNSPMGGGFWQIGITFERMLPVGDYPELDRLHSLASRLVPPRQTTSLVVSQPR